MAAARLPLPLSRGFIMAAERSSPVTTFTTPGSPAAFSPDIVGIAPGEIIPEALIITTSSFAGFVEGDQPAVRVPFISTDDDAGFTAEGSEITEAQPDSSETVIHTGKVAVLAKVSREQYSTGNTASLLSDSMRLALIRKANYAYLAQAAPSSPAVTPPAGLLHLGPTDGGTVLDNLDAVADAITTIEANNGIATHIIASPSAWGELAKLKTSTDSNLSLIGANVEAPQRTLLSVPVTVTSAMPDYGLIVLDRNAVLSAYGNVSLAVSTDAFFAEDVVGVRATFRFGAKIADIGRVVSLDVTPAGS